jgi:4-phytase / acid phosphatase
MKLHLERKTNRADFCSRPDIRLGHLISSRALRAAVIAAVFISNAAPAADYELLSTVIVSRHGVRSPIAGTSSLASIAADPWPSWLVPPGHLTPRGAELARLLGVYYRDYYVARGLLPAQGCPQPGAVFAWADIDQRTRVTAQSLLDGMFPGCALRPGYRVDAKADPLFHPTRAGICRIDPARARQAVLARIGGNFRTVLSTHQRELAAMQSVLKCCAPAMCRASAAAAPCALGDLPTAIVGSDDRIRLSGPIAIGSTAAEIFLLEYAQGLPAQEVAWGRAASLEAMRPLWRLHTLQFDLMQRTPYLAARQASALVDRVVATMRESIDSDGNARPGRKLTLFVGHDTNLANIGGMLGMHWALPSYLPDQTPPAGALHFELLRDRGSGSYAVRVSYIAQSLEQMREVVQLDRSRPPERATATIAGCPANDDGSCAWATFEALASKTIDRACVGANGI